MKRLTLFQIKCLQDAIASVELKRVRATDNFKGLLPGEGHRGQTVASLIANGSLKVLEESQWSYPLRVSAVPESDAVKAVQLIGKSVRHTYNGHTIQPLTVTGVGIKNGIVFVQFTTGSNFFRRFDSVLDDR